MWGALHYASAAEETFVSTDLFETGALISSFGVDESGEIYLAGHGGSILRLVRK